MELVQCRWTTSGRSRRARAATANASMTASIRRASLRANAGHAGRGRVVKRPIALTRRTLAGRPGRALELVAGGGHQGDLVAALGQRARQVVGVVDQTAAAERLHFQKPHGKQYCTARRRPPGPAGRFRLGSSPAADREPTDDHRRQPRRPPGAGHPTQAGARGGRVASSCRLARRIRRPTWARCSAASGCCIGWIPTRRHTTSAAPSAFTARWTSLGWRGP